MLVGVLVRLWVASLRIRISGQLRPLGAGRSCVFAFWHGQQMLLAGARVHPMATLVSWSRDGALQAGVMRALGVRVVRGSSSRGGAPGLRGLLRELEAGHHVAFAVDGPHGPARSAKSGAAVSAGRARAELVPVAAAGSRALWLGRTWDGFEVPLPFSRVVIVFGNAPDPALARTNPALVAREIEAARSRAHRILRSGRWRRLPGKRVIARKSAPGVTAASC